MNDPLEILLSAKAKDVRRQEIEELGLGSTQRRRRILRALQPVRSATIGERITAFFNEWRFVSGSAVGAAAIGVFAVTFFPNFETNTRALTPAEREYAEALGNAVGALPQSKSAASVSKESTLGYEKLAPSWAQTDPQAKATVTNRSGDFPLIMTIASRDPLEVMSSDLRALRSLRQSILSVNYSSSSRRGSIIVTLTGTLEDYSQERYGVGLSTRTLRQEGNVQVALQYVQK